MNNVAENQKQSKHTPGPWEYFEQRHWRGEKMYGCVRGGGVVIVNGCAPGGTEEANANARLIAAAPDAHEILRRIYESPTAMTCMACVGLSHDVEAYMAKAVSK